MGEQVSLDCSYSKFVYKYSLVVDGDSFLLIRYYSIDFILPNFGSVTPTVPKHIVDCPNKTDYEIFKAVCGAKSSSTGGEKVPAKIS